MSCFLFLTLWNTKANNRVFQFLELPVSAYAASMGGSNVALIDDGVNNVFQNPSLLGDTIDNDLSISYSHYLSTANHGSVAYGKSWGKDFLAVGIRYLNYGSIDGRDEFNNSLGRFMAQDLAVSIGYARQLHRDVRIGVALKPIYSNYAGYNSFSIAFDLGLTYYNKQIDLCTSLALLNVGRQIVALDSELGTMPFNLVFSINKSFEKAPIRIHMTWHSLTDWNMDFVNNATFPNKDKNVGILSTVDTVFRHTIWGIDILPWKRRIRLSVSYDHRRAREMSLIDYRSIAGFSFGAGLTLTKFNAAFTASQYQSGVWNFQVTLGTNIDAWRKK